MCEELCLLHGTYKQYDFRSGFDLCQACEDGCTCGLDYQDAYCPRHGDKPPEDKWKSL